jgi:hypothetical protein
MAESLDFCLRRELDSNPRSPEQGCLKPNSAFSGASVLAAEPVGFLALDSGVGEQRHWLGINLASPGIEMAFDNRHRLFVGECLSDLISESVNVIEMPAVGLCDGPTRLEPAPDILAVERNFRSHCYLLVQLRQHTSVSSHASDVVLVLPDVRSEIFIDNPLCSCATHRPTSSRRFRQKMSD